MCVRTIHPSIHPPSDRLLPLLFTRQKRSQHSENRPHCQSGRAVDRAGGAEGGAGGRASVQEQSGHPSEGAGGGAQEVIDRDENSHLGTVKSLQLTF